MKAIIFVCLLFLIIKTDAQNIPPQCITSPTNRPPENSDIKVLCGTEFMELSIFLCPIYNANYNETLMILNGQISNECKGQADFTAVPPVLKFRFSINQQSLSSCNNVFRIDNAPGSGAFSQFSSVQSVNISGMVVSFDPTPGLITYLPQITYMYSCQYPLQYLLNNTEMAVSGVNLAINQNNGSFISTLKMQLFTNEHYNTTLNIPQNGLSLKQRIYVQLSATNLSTSFHLLIDQCFATVSIYPSNSSRYDLIVGCSSDPQTFVIMNGVGQKARFVFESFRFVQHKDLKVSTFYVHCVTRLCNSSMCSTMLPPNCTNTLNRRRRAVEDENSATVTSPAILVGQQATPALIGPSKQDMAKGDEYSSPVVAVIVCVAVLAVLLVMMGAYFTWSLRHKLRL